MARTISTAQEDVLGSAKYDVHLRVEVADSTGGMVNLSNLSTRDWVEAARWDWKLDQPVPELTVMLARDRGPSTGESLSPLDADSTFNFNSTAGFASLVYPGRALDVYTAVTTPDAPAPSSSGYDWVFRGELDDVNWEASPMTLVARSKNMAALADRWVQSSSFAYGSSDGVAVETVIETILDDWTALSTTVLLTPASPSFLIAPAYNPDKQQVLQAVQQNAQLIGWNLHEVWSTASTSWRIKFSEPDRAATSSDKAWTFGPQHYYDVQAMNVSRDDVRNEISVIYGLSTGRAQVVVESSSSKDQYGVRWMEFEESINSAIGTSSEAETLAQAVLDDLKEPPATHEIEVPYFYPAELGDYYEFEANDIHYSSNQYLAVYGIMHEVGRDRHRTRVQVRGQPAGHRLQWLQYRHGGNLVFAEVLSAYVTFSEEGKAIVSVVGTELIASNIYITVGDGTTPADPTAAANDGSVSGARGVITTTVGITTGKSAIVRAVAEDAAGILGPIATFESSKRMGPFHAKSSDRPTTSTSFSVLDSVSLQSSALGGDGTAVISASFTLVGSTSNDFSSVRLGFGPATSNSPTFYNPSIQTSSNTTMRLTLDIVVKRFASTQRLIAITRAYWDPANEFTSKAVESDRSVLNWADASSDRLIVFEGRVDSTEETLTMDWTLANYLGST